MYKLAMPISMNTLNEKTMPQYLEDLRRCRADRVFISGMGVIYSRSSRINTEPERIRAAVEYFRRAGLEVGIWVTTLGNGHSLSAEGKEADGSFTQITGINGESRPSHSCCPLDGNFREACKAAFRRIASFKPDIIMIDDDLRFSGRMKVRFPCFCPLHLKEYYKRIGEEIPREKLEKLILTGSKNKYRSEMLKLFGESILGFARALREAVDEVDPTIRLGQCTYETWDMLGTDPVEISKALAGKTKPFFRISGPPFHSTNIIPIIEYSRQQYAWGRGSGCEMFSEGDVYPRPRFSVPSRPLELFELVMTADGTSNGMLAYMFDYNSKPDYERGYVDRYCRNENTRAAIREIFGGKTPVGIEVVATPHKAEHWELPSELEPKALEMLVSGPRPASTDLLSANSIPTSFLEQSDYPLLIIGENARYVDLSRLSNGAIIDIPAARILKERGVDTGLVSAEIDEAEKEYFPKHDDSVAVFGPLNKREVFYRATVSEKAEVESIFTPNETPASYRYENESGQKFLVLAYDYHRATVKGRVKNFVFGYYRQEQIRSSVEWLSGKKLPAFVERSPGLYTLASEKDGALAVALANVSLDAALDPVIELGRKYSEIRFVDCTGRLEGDKVYLSDLPPYGFCAFEVR